MNKQIVGEILVSEPIQVTVKIKDAFWRSCVKTIGPSLLSSVFNSMMVYGVTQDVHKTAAVVGSSVVAGVGKTTLLPLYEYTWQRSIPWGRNIHAATPEGLAQDSWLRINIKLAGWSSLTFPVDYEIIVRVLHDPVLAHMIAAGKAAVQFSICMASEFLASRTSLGIKAVCIPQPS